MGHNLNENGNRMFYTGETPWHKLGKKLDNPATSKEAIEAANLDYKISMEDIFTQEQIAIPGYKTAMREDTRCPLGIVSNRYKAIQNIEAFDFFDSIVGEGQAIYHTAGALGNGERIWVMAKLPNDLIVLREDIVEKYLLLVNSHDGTSALKMYFSPVRVVCQNTLNLSFSDARAGISIRHMGNIKTKVDEARRILGITVNYYTQFEQIIKSMVDVKLTVEETEKYYDDLLSSGEEGNESTTTKNKKNVLLALFENGRGNKVPEIKHSLWAAYNGVTEYVDHYKTVKNEFTTPTNRLESMWFGSGATMKSKAYDLAVRMVEK